MKKFLPSLEIESVQKLKEGDIYYAQNQYSQAAQCYAASLLGGERYEPLYKIGKCIQNSADPKLSGLTQLSLYQRHAGSTLSQPALAAVFFRAVLNQDLYEKDIKRLICKKHFNPYMSLALCELAHCIAQGVPVQLVDLVNTPYEGLMESEINDSESIELALYMRAILIAPKQPTLKTQACDALKGILKENQNRDSVPPPLLYPPCTERNRSKGDTLWERPLSPHSPSLASS